jgi:hypothetical protein
MATSTGQFGDWYYAVRKTRHGPWPADSAYLAWCAHIPELGDGPLEVSRSQEVHAEFGATPDDAVAKLRRSLLT